MELQIGSIHEPKLAANAVMIWMHGLGAQSNDMAMLAQELAIMDLPLRHIFLNAPIRQVTINGYMQMPAWYDIMADKIVAVEDTAGIVQSSAGINTIIAQQLSHGIAAQRIFLAGFSQGGAMALYTGLRYPQRLGGIICMSAYMPLAMSLQRTVIANNSTTPIFMASGKHDPIVLHEWSLASYELLKKYGCSGISWHSYVMEHNVCTQELLDMAQWIRALF